MSSANDYNDDNDSSTVTANPPIVLSDPPTVTADPPIALSNQSTVAADTLIFLADPPTVTADPPIVLADPPTVTADPPIVHADPSTVAANPLIVHADPPTVAANPLIVFADPPTVTADPSICTVPSDPPKNPNTVLSGTLIDKAIPSASTSFLAADHESTKLVLSDPTVKRKERRKHKLNDDLSKFFKPRSSKRKKTPVVKY